MLEPFFRTILQILFQKLEKSPADSFKQRFVRFYHLVAAKLEDGYGADYFIRHAMSLQENVFVPLYLQIILPNLYKETVINPELIRTVQMGPWTHKVDDGLEARKTAYETLYTLVRVPAPHASSLRD